MHIIIIIKTFNAAETLPIVKLSNVHQNFNSFFLSNLSRRRRKKVVILVENAYLDFHPIDVLCS